MPLSAGQVFAGYKIVRLLGSGGMGEVYLAEHPRLPRRDALKVLSQEVSADPDYRARFRREADLASKLWHPNIVSVHDRGECNGQLWISMDYVDGLDAARLLASRYPVGMPADHVVRIVSAVAGALDYAHKQGLLHRDVKPANIMLTHLDDGDDERRILLADFGIARNLDDISGLTVTNMTVGTVAYSAPEQLMGEDIDGRADQYALAASSYHLLTGSHLFPHSNPAVVISRHLNAAPPALADTHAQLAKLDAVLAVALDKDPTHRFPRCADFARALEQATTPAAGSATAATASAAAAGKWDQRALVSNPPRRWFIPAALLAASTLVAAVALTWHPWTESETSTSTSSSSVLSLTASAPAAPTITSPSLPLPSTTSTTTAAMPAIIDVDPTDYEDQESPGNYRWVYARTPWYQDCGIFPVAAKSTVPEGLSCSVAFPPGTPEVSNPPFSGPPNEVQIILPDGPRNSIGEGGPQTAKTLLPNHRITVGAFSCTALTGGGITCEAPTGGFKFADGVLTKHGPR